jgi:hypothetical protein
VVLGVPAVVLTLIHLANELHRREHSPQFAAVVVVGSLVFLAGLAFAYRGSTLAAVAVGVLAFGELALQLSTHFAAGPLALSALAPTEGIWFTIVLFFLAATCLLTLAVAVVATTNPFGHARRTGSLPLVGVSVAGALLLLLHAVDDVGRNGFGGLSVEDGAFVAVATAAAWVVGALWTAGGLRRGLIVVAVATLNVWWPIYTLHLSPSGVSLARIQQKSGIGLALIAAGAGALALGAFVVAIVWLALVSLPDRARATLPPILRI